jgi:hypothetical protein
MTLEQLFPESVLKALPSTDESYNIEDPMIVAKYFYPDFNWTWYIAGYDPQTKIAYGLVNGFELEGGDIDMNELIEGHGKLGMTLERDLHFKPMKWSEVYSKLSKGEHV